MVCDKAKVISHFSDESSLGFGEWLLVSAKDIAAQDCRIRRLWQALGGGCDAKSALSAVKTWMDMRGIPEHGTAIGRAGLRVFRASKEESYGYTAKFLAFGFSRPLAHVKATYFEGAVGGLSALVGSRRRRSKADGDGDIESRSYVYYNDRNDGGLFEATPEVAEYVCTAAACPTTAAGTTATSVTAATMAVTAAVPGTFFAR